MMTVSLRKLLIAAAAAAWLAFVYSSQGIMIWSKGPLRQSGNGQDSLLCSYFTGLGVIQREYWYSANGIMGRTVCPRLIGLK
jgi:hypothetical protein